MDDIQKMFQTIINNQSAFRQEVLKKFEQIDDRFINLETGLNKKIDDLGKHLTTIR